MLKNIFKNHQDSRTGLAPRFYSQRLNGYELIRKMLTIQEQEATADSEIHFQ